jgi:hypothetical protein
VCWGCGGKLGLPGDVMDASLPTGSSNAAKSIEMNSAIVAGVWLAR